MRESKILAGTEFRTTIVGHNNFFYPSSVTDTVIEDTSCVGLPFVGGGTKAAVSVPESAVKATGSSDKKVIIWVEREKIL